MKTSRATVDANREKVLMAASAGFRRKGFDGVRVADVMREAGLTHGGFGTYFASKDDLAVQACAMTMDNQAEKLRTAADLAAYVDRYLTAANRDSPESACLFPSLAAEVARQGPELRRTFTHGLHTYLDGLDKLAEGQGIGVLSTLIGAMILARAVDDPALSDKILSQASQYLK